MEGSLVEDYRLIKDSAMDLNDNCTDPAMALALGDLGVELNAYDLGEPSIGMEFDSVIMRRFVCTRDGFHANRVIHDDGEKKRKWGTTREGCMAMIEVIRKDHGKWVVTKLETEHTHMVALSEKVRSQADRPLISSSLALIVSELGVGWFTNLTNCNMGIRVNSFGKEGEAQDLVEYLKRKQTENMAFFFAIQVDNNNCITDVFWADV